MIAKRLFGRRFARAPGGLLGCGVAAGPLFVGTFTLAGASRDQYDFRRHSVSSLALGPGGWLQATNFVVTGLLCLAGAVGLERGPRRAVGSPACPALIGAAAIGLIGSGVFVTDPVSGYPPGTSGALISPSRTGGLHNVCGIPIFIGIPVAALLSAGSFVRDGQPGWSLYCAASAVTTASCAALAGAAFGQHPALVASGGLFQRASIASGFAWLTTLSIRTRRELVVQARG